MRVIAQADYKAPSFQTARIRIMQRTQDYAVAANIGGEDDGAIPAWFQTERTEEEAREIARQWHKNLRQDYGMQLVKA